MTHEIRSPIPGVFYRRPSPGEPPFVEVGATVEPDTLVCLVEVMKTFHQLRADVHGTVATIELEDKGMVDPGQLLMTIESADPDNAGTDNAGTDNAGTDNAGTDE